MTHRLRSKVHMGNYKIGYGKPPKASQFKPGRSGNPEGRRKGSLNLVTDLSAELGEKIPVREAGRPRRVSKQRALIKPLLWRRRCRATCAPVASCLPFTHVSESTQPAIPPNPSTSMSLTSCAALHRGC